MTMIVMVTLFTVLPQGGFSPVKSVTVEPLLWHGKPHFQNTNFDPPQKKYSYNLCVSLNSIQGTPLFRRELSRTRGCPLSGASTVYNNS